MRRRHRLLVLGSACACAALLFACSSILGFDDLTSGADAGPGGDGALEGASDGPTDATGTDAVPAVPPGAPSGVVAAPALVTTLAGSGTAAFADGTGKAASFNAPVGVAVDSARNVYVADSLGHRIRKITPGGVVTTLAGSGTAAFANGTGTAASFDTPTGVAVDAAGNVYVADSKNHRIRLVTAAGVVSTFAGSGAADHFDGTGTGADFNTPRGVTSDAAGNLYVADTGNHRIRKVKASPAGETTSTAGSSGPPDPGFAEGQGSSAKFQTPTGIALAGGIVFICDTDNQRLRKMTTAMNVFDVSTLAGSGTATFAEGTGSAASFSTPSGAAVDTKGNVLVADTNNHRIRKVTSGGVVTTLAGAAAAAFADGPVAVARFDGPSGLAVDADGKIYVGDTKNHRIRKIASLDPGQLEVSWGAPASSGSAPITGYTATAVAAASSVKCTAVAPATTCTLTGLTSGVSYSVTVTADNGAKGAPSSPVTATPN